MENKISRETSEEEFAKTLEKVRGTVSVEEVQRLTEHLGKIQTKLIEVKKDLRREKVSSDLSILYNLSNIIISCNLNNKEIILTQISKICEHILNSEFQEYKTI